MTAPQAAQTGGVNLRVMLEEIRMLEVIRRALKIDRLVASALERGARARYQVA